MEGGKGGKIGRTNSINNKIFKLKIKVDLYSFFASPLIPVFATTAYYFCNQINVLFGTAYYSMRLIINIENLSRV